MLRIWRLLILALCISSASMAFPNSAIDDLTPEQAYQQGMLLYQQNKYTQARPLLKHAANRGYPAAALMYADTFYANLFIQTEEESEYIVKAAEMGSIIGMLRAGGNRAINGDSRLWKARASRVINKLVNQENAFAMELLYSSVEDRDEGYSWLKKAAEAGDPFSQHELARRYEMGDDWFFIPGKREKEIERLFKASSNSGYWLGMRTYAHLLRKQGDIVGYQTIIDTLLEAGDALTILGLGVYDIEFDKFESAADYSKIYVDSRGNEGQNSGYNAAQSVYDEAIVSLTPEQIKQVDLKVQQYLKTHTVRYQKRIKDYEYTVDSFK